MGQYQILWHFTKQVMGSISNIALSWTTYIDIMLDGMSGSQPKKTMLTRNGKFFLQILRILSVFEYFIVQCIVNRMYMHSVHYMRMGFIYAGKPSYIC